MLKKVMKARDARASDEASPLLVCSFATFLAEYSAPYNLEPALHRCLTSLEFFTRWRTRPSSASATRSRSRTP